MIYCECNHPHVEHSPGNGCDFYACACAEFTRRREPRTAAGIVENTVKLINPRGETVYEGPAELKR